MTNLLVIICIIGSSIWIVASVLLNISNSSKSQQVSKLLSNLENEYLQYSNKSIQLLVIEKTNFQYDSLEMASEIMEILKPIINAFIIKLTVDLSVKSLDLRNPSMLFISVVAYVEHQHEKHYRYDSKYIIEKYRDGITSSEKKVVYDMIKNSIIADLNKRILSLKVGN